MDKGKEKSFFIAEGVTLRCKLTLKQRVEFLLQSKGMTYSELSDLIGINKGTTSKIINGLWSPTAKIKILMAKHLHVDSLVLFGDEQYFHDYQTSIKKMGEEK